MTAERWALIEGVDSSYSVSDLGRVRNNDSGLILSQTRLTHHGYVTYRLMADGRWREFRGHRLVAAAFLGEPTGPVVRHLDDVKTNNVVGNLAYGNQSDNMFDAVRNGTSKKGKWQTHCGKGHEMTDANQYWSKGRAYPLCRTCKNETARRNKARARAEVAA